MKNIFKSALFTALTALFLSSCVDQEFDEPPESTLPYDPAKVYTIQDIKNIIDTTGSYVVTEDYSLFATCSMDDRTGNLYKAAYIFDSTGAIQLFDNAQGLYEGDSVRIWLNGVTFSSYSEQYQIQNLTTDLNIVKLDVLKEVPVKLTSIAEINTQLQNMQGQLIQLTGVQFAAEEVGKTFADGENLETLNRLLIDGETNQIYLRTSGYANFADSLLPDGNGTITAVLGQFGEDAQLYLRRTTEIEFNDEANYIRIQGFESGLGGWQTVNIEGDQQWEIISYGNPGNCISMSGYDNGNFANEDWLISPKNTISDADTIIFNFETAKNYDDTPLDVFVSSDFNGQDVLAATWEPLQAELSAGDWNWIGSGDIDLSEYVDQDFYIAFRFTCPANESATWEVDNILILGK